MVIAVTTGPPPGINKGSTRDQQATNKGPVGGKKISMSEQPEDDTLSIQIANQIINVANTRVQDGAGANEVARGLRHAAANFSAFAEHQRRDGGADSGAGPGGIVEEFSRFLEYYLDRHGATGEPGGGPAAGLEQLIEQVKKEL